MNRKTLVRLLADGMRYPQGKHRLWISKCFEITVLPDRVVELDEYEDFSEENSAHPRADRAKTPKKLKEMFHVGRTILRLEDGHVLEEAGSGWRDSRA